MNHQFVIMWCNEGLEYIGDITADDQRMIVESLRGKESPRRALANPHHLRLRAQFNPQRHYEIYFVTATAGITESDIRDMFEADPQTAADTIRQLGTVFYSDRATKKAAIV
jgi:hypothetical protein